MSFVFRFFLLLSLKYETPTIRFRDSFAAATSCCHKNLLLNSIKNLILTFVAFAVVYTSLKDLFLLSAIKIEETHPDKTRVQRTPRTKRTHIVVLNWVNTCTMTTTTLQDLNKIFIIIIIFPPFAIHSSWRGSTNPTNAFS